MPGHVRRSASFHLVPLCFRQYASRTRLLKTIRNLGCGRSPPMLETRNTGVDSPRAWLIVLAAFFASFVAFGVSYSFGIFLKPLATEFGVSHAVMSTLFSVLIVLSLFLSPLTGDIADHLGPRPVVGAADGSRSDPDGKSPLFPGGISNLRTG